MSLAVERTGSHSIRGRCLDRRRLIWEEFTRRFRRLDMPSTRWYLPRAPAKVAGFDNPELVVMSLMSVGFAAGSTGPLLAAVSIDLDKSVLLQMVVFAVLIIVLKPLLFDPVLRVFALREERTEGAKETARELQLKAGDLLTRYEKELDRVNRAVAEERDKARLETARLESEILEEASKVVQRIEDEGRKRIEQEVGRLRSDLKRQSDLMARQIASKVLGREVAS